MINFDKDELYPLLFEPLYKEVMWGGTQLASKLNRPIPKDGPAIGEAWEICDREGFSSLVANGPLAGTSLHELVSSYGKEFVGHRFNGGHFPLLVKLIDAGKRLSLQVHPNEEACAKIGGGAEPKTEMWYVIAAERGAKIIAGLSGKSTRRQFVENLNSADIEKLLQVFDSYPGDAYFINAGRVHAIGSGNLLLEIQQNSDTTYRISDWGRTDSSGKPRQLHIEQAMESIDFMDRTVPRITGASDTTDHNRKYPLINRCPFFRVDDLKLVEDWYDSTDSTASFHLLTAINHPVKVGRDDKITEVPVGSTCLLPASFGSYNIIVERGVTSTVVRTTL